MATVLAAAYADVGLAAAALERVRSVEGVEDATLVTRTPEGRVELRQERQPAVGEGLVAGGTVGLVLGLVLGGPIAGAVAGLAAGAGYAARDRGIPDGRMRELGRELEPGAAAVFVLAEDVGAAARALAPYDGELGTAPG